MKTTELFSIIEFLPIDLKITLVEKILESIHPSQKDIDALWNKEAEKRVNEIKSGKVNIIPGDEVFEKCKSFVLNVVSH